MARFAFYRRGDFTDSREKVNKEKVGFVTLPCTRSLRRSDADIKLLYVLFRGRPSISVAFGLVGAIQWATSPHPHRGKPFWHQETGGDLNQLLLTTTSTTTSLFHHTPSFYPMQPRTRAPRALSGLLPSPSPITILD